MLRLFMYSPTTYLLRYLRLISKIKTTFDSAAPKRDRITQYRGGYILFSGGGEGQAEQKRQDKLEHHEDEFSRDPIVKYHRREMSVKTMTTRAPVNLLGPDYVITETKANGHKFTA